MLQSQHVVCLSICSQMYIHHVVLEKDGDIKEKNLNELFLSQDAFQSETFADTHFAFLIENLPCISRFVFTTCTPQSTPLVLSISSVLSQYAFVYLFHFFTASHIGINNIKCKKTIFTSTFPSFPDNTFQFLWQRVSWIENYCQNQSKCKTNHSTKWLEWMSPSYPKRKVEVVS